MAPTTQALLQSLATNDPSLSEHERGMLHRLVEGMLEAPETKPTWSDAPLLLTQKQAARVQGVSRVTLWRLTREGVFTPVELTPGSLRNRLEEI
ncbi:MAG: hypothetical protein J6386_23625 [Candidatus Synoicihabitans palmerolidicus]|nr:hypothetical protein [Candidatus Synoicihabitans palmerolidicus]